MITTNYKTNLFNSVFAMASSFCMILLMSAPTMAQVYQHDFFRTYDLNSTVAVDGKTIIYDSLDVEYEALGKITLDDFNNTNRILFHTLTGSFNTDEMKAYVHPSEIGGNAYANFYPSNMYLNEDGSRIICGKYIDEGQLNGAFLLELTSSGAVNWFNVYPNITGLNSVIESFNGGYVACGTMPYNGSSRSGIVIETNSSGSIISSFVSYSTTGSQSMLDSYYGEIIRIGNEDDEFRRYAVVGGGNEFTKVDVMVTFLDADLNILWNKFYGIALDVNNDLVQEEGRAIVFDKTNDQLIVGGSVRNGNCTNGNRSILLFAIDTATTGVNWSMQYRDGTEVYGYNLENRNNDVYMTGYSDGEPFILRAENSNGNYIDYRRYPGNSPSSSITSTNGDHMAIYDVTDKYAAFTEFYVAERYDMTTDTCVEQEIDLIEYDINLPSHNPLDDEVAPELHDLELVAIDLENSEYTPCEKTRSLMKRNKTAISETNATEESIQIRKTGINRYKITTDLDGENKCLIYSINGQILDRIRFEKQVYLSLDEYPHFILLNVVNTTTGKTQVKKVLRD